MKIYQKSIKQLSFLFAAAKKSISPSSKMIVLFLRSELILISAEQALRIRPNDNELLLFICKSVSNGAKKIQIEIYRLSLIRPFHRIFTFRWTVTLANLRWWHCLASTTPDERCGEREHTRNRRNRKKWPKFVSHSRIKSNGIARI